MGPSNQTLPERQRRQCGLPHQLHPGAVGSPGQPGHGCTATDRAGFDFFSGISLFSKHWAAAGTRGRAFMTPALPVLCSDAGGWSGLGCPCPCALARPQCCCSHLAPGLCSSPSSLRISHTIQWGVGFVFPLWRSPEQLRADRQTCIGLQIALDSQAWRCFINIPYYYGALLITALGNNGSTQQLWSSDANQPSLRGAMGRSQKSIYLGKHSIYTQAQGMREALEEAGLCCLLLAMHCSGARMLLAIPSPPCTQYGDVAGPGLFAGLPSPHCQGCTKAATLGIRSYLSSSPGCARRAGQAGKERHFR